MAIMNGNRIAMINRIAFAVELYRDIRLVVLASATNDILYDILAPFYSPYNLHGFRYEAAISIGLCVFFWIEKKFLLNKFEAIGVPEKVCTRIKKFRILSVVTTILYLNFILLAMQ